MKLEPLSPSCPANPSAVNAIPRARSVPATLPSGEDSNKPRRAAVPAIVALAMILGAMSLTPVFTAATAGEEPGASTYEAA